MNLEQAIEHLESRLDDDESYDLTYTTRLILPQRYHCKVYCGDWYWQANGATPEDAVRAVLDLRQSREPTPVGLNPHVKVNAQLAGIVALKSLISEFETPQTREMFARFTARRERASGGIEIGPL